jgi:DNA replication regulator DPB11
MSLLDALGMAGMRSTEESMRVTYEDPGQAEEKRRLLRMLGGDEDEAGMRVGSGPGVAVRGVVVGAGRTRRNKRAKVPGF